MKIAYHLKDNGFCFLNAFREADQGTDIILALGSLSTVASENRVHNLIPKRITDSTPNTYSGIYGLDNFPLHTDFANWFRPPRYLILRCVIGFDDVATPALDSFVLVSKIGTDLLYRAIVKPRRPVAGATTSLRLYDVFNGNQIFRWDLKYLTPANEAANEAFSKINHLLDETPKLHFRLSKPGDTLIIDNWRMLHGRSNVPEECSNRVIQRAYMDAIYEI